MRDYTSLSSIYVSIARGLQIDVRDAEVVNAYDSSQIPTPIVSPIVVLGVNSIELPFKEGVLKGSNSSSVLKYGISAKCDMYINIYQPKTNSVTDSMVTLDSVVNSLVANTDIDLISITCFNAYYDNKVGATVLKAKAQFNASIV